MCFLFSSEDMLKLGGPYQLVKFYHEAMLLKTVVLA